MRNEAALRAVVCGLFLLPYPAALAQLRVSTAGDNTLYLTVRDAVRIAIHNNPDLKANVVTVQRSEAASRAARGIFDPIIRLGGETRRESRPTSSLLEGANGRLDEHRLNGYAGVRQQLPFQGASVEAQIENSRLSSTNPFLSLTPYYTPRASVTLNFPLLRGRATDEGRTEIVVRSREFRAARAELEVRLADLANRVETAYWQIVAARDSLNVAEQTEQAARDALASTERLVREGESAGSEIAGAAGQLARAQGSLAEASGNERQAQDALKSLLAFSVADTLLGQNIRPTDERAMEEATPTATLISEAFEHRPELRVWDEKIRQGEDRFRLAANASLPRVDLQVGYVTQGLSGKPLPLSGATSSIPGLNTGVPAGVIGSTWSGFRQVFDNRFPTYFASLSIEWTPRNRAANGRYSEAHLAEHQAQLQREQSRLQIALEVRQAVNSLIAARERTQTAERAMKESDDRLASELRLFRGGQSNNLNVNVRQNELAESRLTRVRAWERFSSASADLRRATGRSLTTFDIRVEEAQP